MKSNKVLMALLAVVGAIVLGYGIFYMYGTSVYSGAVEKQEAVNEKWANVQTAYQRRADLVPQLIATVKGAAANEEKILTEVTNARAGIKSATTPEEIQQQGSIINRNIQVVFEKYPEIRSTENFGMLQAQLEGTENQVKTERDLYNEAVKEFNTYVRGFWKHKALGLVGNDDEEFKVRKMFEADAGSENAPKVSFE
ncbi:MAG: LemA family protein [Sediminibacterium sp.]